MAQFEVFRNPVARTRGSVPFVMDVQANVLVRLNTRMVVPLYHSERIPRPIRNLQPTFSVEQHSVVMATNELAGVPISALGERVGSLSAERAAIIAALDLLFTGV